MIRTFEHMKYLFLFSIVISFKCIAQELPSAKVLELFPELSMDFSIGQLNLNRSYDEEDFSEMGEYGEIRVDSNQLIFAEISGLDTVFTGAYKAPSRFYSIGRMTHQNVTILLYLEESYTENRNAATYTDVNQVVKAAIYFENQLLKTFVFYESDSYQDYSVNYYTYITKLTSFEVLNDDLVHVKLYEREMWVEEYFGEMDVKKFKYLKNKEELVSLKIEEDGTLVNISE